MVRPMKRDPLGPSAIGFCTIPIALGLLVTIVAVNLARRVRADDAPPAKGADAEALRFPQEKHLANLRQLTFGGQNAEAYFSTDDRRLIFQSARPPFQCDQMFTMSIDGSDVKLVSTGKGKCTCGYYFHGDDRILFSSTHLASPDCPPRPDYSKGYVWPIHDGHDIFTAKADGSDLRRLTDAPGYDAEATISEDGKKIVFTSVRDGDLDIYTMNADGSDVRRLTNELGYDGGAFFSHDGKKIVFRAYHPKTDAEIADYKDLLAKRLIRPTTLELWIMDADGSNKHQITHLNAASFGPFMCPGDDRVIFASNVNDPKHAEDFDLFTVKLDGTGLEQVTFSPVFDGFPMFSHDGKKLVFASNRGAKAPHETNVFIADWVD